jgi:hypothetical protein
MTDKTKLFETDGYSEVLGCLIPYESDKPDQPAFLDVSIIDNAFLTEYKCNDLAEPGLMVMRLDSNLEPLDSVFIPQRLVSSVSNALQEYLRDHANKNLN